MQLRDECVVFLEEYRVLLGCDEIESNVLKPVKSPPDGRGHGDGLLTSGKRNHGKRARSGARPCVISIHLAGCSAKPPARSRSC